MVQLCKVARLLLPQLAFVKPSDLNLIRISGAMTNMIYEMQVLDEQGQVEFRTLLRIYGQGNSERAKRVSARGVLYVILALSQAVHCYSIIVFMKRCLVDPTCSE